MGASRGRTTDHTNRPSVTQGWAHAQAPSQSCPISRPPPTLPTGSSSDHNYLLFRSSSVPCTKAVSRPVKVSLTAWEWTDLNSGPLLWLSGKKSTCKGRRHIQGSIPGLGRSPAGGNGNLLQYYCLENSMGRRAWAGSQGVGHSD